MSHRSNKFVKDKNHNRYPAYCCDDIDERLGALEEVVAALVAGTVPDGAVTLAKLANDARTYTREINHGTLISEWIGTHDEYEAHLYDNGGKPLPNVRYTITDDKVVPELNASKKLSGAGYYYIAAKMSGGTFYNFGQVYWDGATETSVGAHIYGTSSSLLFWKATVLTDGALKMENIEYLCGDNVASVYNKTSETAFYTVKIEE